MELTSSGRANEDERDGENVQLPNLLRLVLENTRELLSLRGQNEHLQTSLNESKLENLSLNSFHWPQHQRLTCHDSCDTQLCVKRRWFLFKEGQLAERNMHVVDSLVFR